MDLWEGEGVRRRRRAEWEGMGRRRRAQGEREREKRDSLCKYFNIPTSFSIQWLTKKFIPCVVSLWIALFLSLSLPIYQSLSRKRAIALHYLSIYLKPDWHASIYLSIFYQSISFTLNMMDMAAKAMRLWIPLPTSWTENRKDKALFVFQNTAGYLGRKKFTRCSITLVRSAVITKIQGVH